eukprot:CAMPEP_0178437550 /NCGR_PEP_ID=MMETSP0689_2-20121128/35066_1 /TAXON_ID=160604 /ORGANISM="Amphidinium massartii, Strain CS-259" /LENGTH=188 /DNA_ID=CAMNT_0020059787 /DNA_START=186 /DNA_END=749 /DNA_ORIENTATION=-
MPDSPEAERKKDDDEESDPLGVFYGGKEASKKNGKASRSPSRSRSGSASPRRKKAAGDDVLGLFPADDAPKKRSTASAERGGSEKRQDAEDLDIPGFVKRNRLEDRVGRIMNNMHPDDVQRVMSEGDVPENCRNPNAVIVSRIRRVEKEAQRPNAMAGMTTGEDLVMLEDGGVHHAGAGQAVVAAAVA